MSFKVKSFSEIIERMITYITTYTTKITDFNKASTNRTLLESVAWTIKEILNDIFLAFRNNLKTFIYEAFGFAEKEEEKAVGTVRFSSNEAPTSDIPIPINTIIETDDGVGFITTAEGVQLTGQLTTVDIPIIAQVGGESGNVKVSTITNLVTSITGIDAVTNTVPTTGGADAESDEDSQKRFQKAVQNLGRSTVGGIEAGAESVAGVNQAKLYETETLGLMDLFIDDGSGVATQDLLDDVQFVIEGNGTPEYPGYRGAGTIIRYKSSAILPITISQTLWVKKGYKSDLIDNVQAAQAEFINSRKIGETLVKEKLEAEALKFTEVLDINMTLPAANVETDLSLGQVVKSISFTDPIIIEVE